MQIAKYGYEINQLKIILDALREKETGKKNSNLNIFSRISQGLLNTNYYNNSEGNKSNYHVCYSNNLTTDKVLLIYILFLLYQNKYIKFRFLK